jgi:hypothetical protein
MNEIPECKYHMFLTTLTEEISEKLDDHYNWQFFHYWLGDESNFGGVYRGAFEIYNEIFNGNFTEEQLELVANKGRNLEHTIKGWLERWKARHPNDEGKMPLSCLKHKVYEYIVYQLKQPDMRELVGRAC